MFRGCLFTVFDSFAIPPALLVALVLACLCRAIALLGFPTRPLPSRLPTLLAAITLPCALRTKTLFAPLQQTSACPRPAASSGHRTGFLIISLACRILNRAHGSVAPGSSCLREDLHSSLGRSMSGSTQTPESIAGQLAAPIPGFLLHCNAVRHTSTPSLSDRWVPAPRMGVYSFPAAPPSVLASLI